MHFITRLRSKLNCSQLEFADLFNTSRSTILRAENDATQLEDGSNYVLKLIDDRISACDKSNSKKAVMQNGLSASEKQTIKKRNVEIALTLIRLESDLEEIPVKHQYASAAYQYFQSILANPEKLNQKQLHWMRGKMGLQSIRMENFGSLVQHQLKVKIAQLKLEMQMSLKMLK